MGTAAFAIPKKKPTPEEAVSAALAGAEGAERDEPRRRVDVPKVEGAPTWWTATPRGQEAATLAEYEPTPSAAVARALEKAEAQRTAEERMSIEEFEKRRAEGAKPTIEAITRGPIPPAGATRKETWERLRTSMEETQGRIAKLADMERRLEKELGLPAGWMPRPGALPVEQTLSSIIPALAETPAGRLRAPIPAEYGPVGVPIRAPKQKLSQKEQDLLELRETRQSLEALQKRLEETAPLIMEEVGQMEEAGVEPAGPAAAPIVGAPGEPTADATQRIKELSQEGGYTTEAEQLRDPDIRHLLGMDTPSGSF